MYIYFKCFRKPTNARKMELEAQYKSLRFDAVAHPEQQGGVNTDFTYLSPVFSRNENQESRRTGSIGHDDVQDDVYIEMTERFTESSI